MSSLDDYGFRGGPRKQTAGSSRGSSSPRKSEYASQRNDAWVDPSPRKGRKLPPNEKDELDEVGDEVESEKEERLVLEPPTPIDLDEEESATEEEREPTPKPRKKRPSKPVEINSETSSEEEEEPVPVAPVKKLVRGNPKAATPPPASSESELEVVSKGLSAKAKGKRRAISPRSSEEEAEDQPPSPAKRLRRAGSTSSLPSISDALQPARKLQRGRPSSPSSLPIIRLPLEKKSSERTLQRGAPSSSSGLSVVEPAHKPKAKPKKRSPRKKQKKAISSDEDEAFDSDEEEILPQPSTSRRLTAQSSRQEKMRALIESRNRKKIVVDTDDDEPRRSPRKKPSSRIFRRAEAAEERNSTAGFNLTLLGDSDLEHGDSDEPRDRSPTPRPHISRKTNDGSPSPRRRRQQQLGMATEDDEPSTRKGKKKQSSKVKRPVVRTEQSGVAETSSSGEESSGEDKIIELGSDEDIALDHKVEIDDRLRPKPKHQDKFAQLKAARAGKSRDEPQSAIDLESDKEVEEPPVQKVSRVINVDSSSEDEKSGSDAGVESQTSPHEDDFIVPDENEEEARNAARKMMPAQYTNAASETLKQSLHTVVYGIFCHILDPEHLWFEKENDFGFARQRARQRIDEALPSLVKSSVWTSKFNESIDAYPNFGSDRIEAEPGCEVCGNATKISTYEIKLDGSVYDRDIYSRIKNSGFAKNLSFKAGRFCYDRALTYHELKHWEHTAWVQLKAILHVPHHLSEKQQQKWAEQRRDELRKAGADFDQIVNRVLEDFTKAQYYVSH